MTVAIVGSRSITEIRTLKGAMIMAEQRGIIDWKKVDLVLSGGAIGVDELARKMWKEYGPNPPFRFREILPNYRKHVSASAACYERNQAIVDRSDAMLALWDGLSGGTIDVVKRARRKGIPVYLGACW